LKKKLALFFVNAVEYIGCVLKNKPHQSVPYGSQIFTFFVTLPHFSACLWEL